MQLNRLPRVAPKGFVYDRSNGRGDELVPASELENSRRQGQVAREGDRQQRFDVV